MKATISEYSNKQKKISIFSADFTLSFTSLPLHYFRLDLKNPSYYSNIAMWLYSIPKLYMWDYYSKYCLGQQAITKPRPTPVALGQEIGRVKQLPMMKRKKKYVHLPFFSSYHRPLNPRKNAMSATIRSSYTLFFPVAFTQFPLIAFPSSKFPNNIYFLQIQALESTM